MARQCATSAALPGMRASLAEVKRDRNTAYRDALPGADIGLAGGEAKPRKASRIAGIITCCGATCCAIRHQSYQAANAADTADDPPRPL